jgi:hypothetical protein
MVGLGALVAFVSFVTVAYGYYHSTNGSVHGLNDSLPRATTQGAAIFLTTAEMRHYFDNGDYHVQCADADAGFAECEESWGTAPCQKRSVNGAETVLSRHWVRRSGCPGTLHP